VLRKLLQPARQAGSAAIAPFLHGILRTTAGHISAALQAVWLRRKLHKVSRLRVPLDRAHLLARRCCSAGPLPGAASPSRALHWLPAPAAGPRPPPAPLPSAAAPVEVHHIIRTQAPAGRYPLDHSEMLAATIKRQAPVAVLAKANARWFSGARRLRRTHARACCACERAR
jgi:hypothetical protein